MKEDILKELLFALADIDDTEPLTPQKMRQCVHDIPWDQPCKSCEEMPKFEI